MKLPDEKKTDPEKAQNGPDEILPGEQVMSIPLHKIRPNPFQPRKAFDDIDELAASIKEEGVLQPVIVRKVTDPTSEFLYELLSGERRWRASKKAGKSHIPAIIREASEEDMKTKAALENTARKDLNFVETMNCYQILVEHYRDTESVANKVGKSRKHVNEYLKIREEIYKHPKVAEIFEAQARTITYSAAKAFSEVAAKVYRLEKSNNREFQRIIKNMDGGVIGCIDWVIKKVVKSDKKEEAHEAEPLPPCYLKETENDLILSVKVPKKSKLPVQTRDEILKSLETFREKVSSLAALSATENISSKE